LDTSCRLLSGQAPCLHGPPQTGHSLSKMDHRSPKRGAAAKASSRGSRIVTDHHVYEPPSERTASRYVAIDTTEHVPFILESAPATTEDSSGRPLLSITLDAKYKEKLKEFTTRYLDKSVAILVGGELVSVHKIRSVIPEGKLQVTSCGADVCKVLYSKLVGTK